MWRYSFALLAKRREFKFSIFAVRVSVSQIYKFGFKFERSNDKAKYREMVFRVSRDKPLFTKNLLVYDIIIRRYHRRQQIIAYLKILLSITQRDFDLVAELILVVDPCGNVVFDGD